jgi:hypothetical protein
MSESQMSLTNWNDVNINLTHRIRWLLFFVVIGSFVFFYWNKKDQANLASGPENRSKNIESQQVRAIEKRVDKTIDSQRAQNCVAATGGVWPEKPIRSIEANSAVNHRLKEKGFDNPDSLILSARRGDGLSAIVAFEIVSSCFPLSKEELREISPEGGVKSPFAWCPILPKDVVSDRLNLLDVAANAGSVDAKATYAFNADTIARHERSLATNDSVLRAEKIMQKAELYGAAAAQDGVKEALYFMARAYRIGLFGSRDFTRTYAYSLPLAAIEKSPLMDEELRKLRQQLSVSQVAEAERIAFGCRSGPLGNPNIGVSPFSSVK